MTDQEIVQGLIARDNQVTEDFFFVRCRPLFCSIMNKIYGYAVDYDELVNELYVYLMADDAYKLRQFGFRSSVYQWLKVLATRFFIRRRGEMIENSGQETPYDKCSQLDAVPRDTSAEYDMERLFEAMPTKRYAYVIRQLVIEDKEPEQLAQEMNITTANLYNIKRRAMAQLTRTALKDRNEYGKKE